MRSTPPSPDVALAAPPPGRPFGGASALAAAARIGLASTFAAWPVLTGRALFYALILVVLSALWDKVAAERVAGAMALPAGDLAIYVGVTEWITFSVTAVHLRLEDDIRSGLLEPHLLRPKSYLVQRVGEAVGASLARMLAIGATGLGLLLVSGRAGLPLAALPAVAALGVLGMVVGVLLYTVVGLTAFWLRRVMPAFLIAQKLVFLLGGLFAPIALYPPWLRTIAELTPFGAHLAFAGQAAIDAGPAYILRAVALQGTWIAVLALAAMLVWRGGVARVMREGV
jgi:ABC-2 type transport system permease protein